MQPDSTTFSNKFLDAVLRLKCPARHKELLFAIVRIIKSSDLPNAGASINNLSKYLGQDKSNISRRLNNLIVANVLQETRRPGYTTARVLMLNTNYSEWKAIKYSPVKTKIHCQKPNLCEDKKAAAEKAAAEKAAAEKAAAEKAAAEKAAAEKAAAEKAAAEKAAAEKAAAVEKPKLNENFFPKTPETTTVAKTTTVPESPHSKELMEFRQGLVKQLLKMNPDYEKKLQLRKLEADARKLKKLVASAKGTKDEKLPKPP